MTTAGNSGSSPTVLCPGQGAQAIGMGRAWADAAPEAAAVFDRSDAILGDAGFEGSIREVCFEGPSERLNRTDVSQPAIYVTSVASWCGLCAAEGADPASRPIAAAAGLSLGEYTALHIAGSLTFEDGLRLVALRGRAMQDAAEASPSSMVAVIGTSEEDAQSLCERATGQCSGAAILVPANFNAPGQVVMSGSLEACDAVERVAGEMGFKASRLAVAGAFHSPLMAPRGRSPQRGARRHRDRPAAGAGSQQRDRCAARSGRRLDPPPSGRPAHVPGALGRLRPMDRGECGRRALRTRTREDARRVDAADRPREKGKDA